MSSRSSASAASARLPRFSWRSAIAWRAGRHVVFAKSGALAAAGASAGPHEGLGRAVRILFATNFVWFVLPFVHPLGSDVPWGGAALAEWVPFALPFFHCAQYLGVCGFRARTAGPMRPAFYSGALVVLGLLLFEATTRSLPYLSALDYERSLMLVPAVINIHHFFLDGLMWKTRRKPASEAVAADSTADALPSRAA